MKIETALLCEAASVREGLLNVLGAGVTALHRNAYPAPLNLTVALVFEVNGADEGQSQKFRISIEKVEGGQIAYIEGGWDADSLTIDRGASAFAPIAIKLDQVSVPEPGSYIARFEIDGGDSRLIRFQALLVSSEFDAF